MAFVFLQFASPERVQGLGVSEAPKAFRTRMAITENAMRRGSKSVKSHFRKAPGVTNPSHRTLSAMPLNLNATTWPIRRSSVFNGRVNMADKAASQNKSHTGDKAATEEARHLAKEAMDELKRGNKEEAEFVLNEARGLDNAVVDQVVRSHQKK
jgi:hypothetical protein